jgi:geranylgeranyl diphosphate synthase type II
MTAQTLIKLSKSSTGLDSSIDELVRQVDALIDGHIFGTATESSQIHNLALQAAKYHLDAPGQKVRMRLCLSACLELNVEYDDMLIISAVSELLHNASLIHDDIQDMDEIRRGQITVWKKYGTNIAICAGDLLLSSAYSLLAGISNTKSLPIIISLVGRRTSSVIEGQSDDIEYKAHPIQCIDTYVRIAKAKSGALLGLPLELAIVMSTQNHYLEIVRKSVSAFSVAYQMADDLQDIEKDSPANGLQKSLNVVHLLKDAGSEDPVGSAVKLTEQYLSEAAQSAEMLPDAMSEHLLKMIQQIQTQLKNDHYS